MHRVPSEHEVVAGRSRRLENELRIGLRLEVMNGYLDVVDSWFRDNIAENGDGGAILNGRSEAQNALSTGAGCL